MSWKPRKEEFQRGGNPTVRKRMRPENRHTIFDSSEVMVVLGKHCPRLTVNQMKSLLAASADTHDPPTDLRLVSGRCLSIMRREEYLHTHLISVDCTSLQGIC